MLPGMPLALQGCEFISINKWPFAVNSSCVLDAVFSAARPYMEPRCLGRCPAGSAEPSASPCFLRCMFAAIIERTPQSVIRATLAALQRGGSAHCERLEYDLFHGPIDFAMGGSRFWDFGGKHRTVVTPGY